MQCDSQYDQKHYIRIVPEYDTQNIGTQVPGEVQKVPEVRIESLA